MSDVLLDAVGVIALLNRQDQWHDGAASVFALLVGQRRRLFATSLVMAEVGNAFARTAHRESVAAFHDELLEQGRVVFPTESDWRFGWGAYRRSSAGGPSFVDCVSFEVMRRRGVREAFTNDRHFADAGFRVLF